MLWQRCWEHYINLMVKALLGLTVFRDSCKQAIDAGKGINASMSKWSPQILTRADQMYGKHRSKNIMIVVETHWNSTQGCFASLLRMRGACRVFAIYHQYVPKFPMACIPWCENSFWITLKNAELLICPFCNASFLMQRNSKTMAHVLLVLFHLAKHIQESCGDISESRFLLLDIDKRCKREETALFFLAFDLHPSFHKVRWVSCLSRQKRMEIRTKLAILSL